MSKKLTDLLDKESCFVFLKSVEEIFADRDLGEAVIRARISGELDDISPYRIDDSCLNATIDDVEKILSAIQSVGFEKIKRVFEP